MSADTVPVEKWGPACAKHDSRSKLEMSLRNNTAMIPVSQVLSESCSREKKDSKRNAGVFFSLYG